jgi:beta-lactamase superfamily II metal-dependent hydrolase
MIIEMFPAEQGDAFLIRLENKMNILVDMGYATTYRDFIKKRLIEVKNENQCIDLLVITHIDEDHIQGAIEFFKENGNADNPNIIEVKEIWHNSYRHLQFEKDKTESITNSEKRQLEGIILSNSGSSRETNQESPISARQGSALAGYLYAYGYSKTRWNSSFDSKAVSINNRELIEIEDLKLYLLSPDNMKLKKLSKEWIRKLKIIDIDFSVSDDKMFDDAYEMYIKYLSPIIANEHKDISFKIKDFGRLLKTDIVQECKDMSGSNGSSIAFILEYKESKLLFLGDAHEDVVMESLVRYNSLGNSLDFDLVKSSHHGSIMNNFDWIEKINSENYLISTNGKGYNHPDIEVIAKIVQSNKKLKNIYFNYPLEICKDIQKEKFESEFHYNIIIGDGNSSLKIEVNDDVKR